MWDVKGIEDEKAEAYAKEECQRLNNKEENGDWTENNDGSNPWDLDKVYFQRNRNRDSSTLIDSRYKTYAEVLRNRIDKYLY